MTTTALVFIIIAAISVLLNLYVEYLKKQEDVLGIIGRHTIVVLLVSILVSFILAILILITR